MNAKHITFGVIVLLVLIQFIPVDRENPTYDKTSEITAPAEVKTIIETSCYDCHSYDTEWPIYSYIAPVSWLVAHDVEEGRRHINFSEWNKLSDREMIKDRQGIYDEVDDGEMPLAEYLIMHSNAKLSPEQKKVLLDWAKASDEKVPETETKE